MACLYQRIQMDGIIPHAGKGMDLKQDKAQGTSKLGPCTEQASTELTAQNTDN